MTILTVLFGMVSIALFTVGLIQEMRQTLVASGITLLITLAGVILIYLSRRDRTRAGSRIFILLAISLSVPLLSLFIAGFGWIILLSVPLVITIISQANFQSKFVAPAVIFGFLSGTAGLLLDLFGSQDRPSIPYSSIVIPILGLGAVAIGLVILIRVFQNLTLRMKLLWMFLFVSIVPVILLVLLNHRFTSNTLIQNANQNLASTAQQTSKKIDEFIDRSLETMEAEARLPILRDFLLGNPVEDSASQRNSILITLAILQRRDIENILAVAILDQKVTTREIYPYPTDDPNLGQTYSGYVPSLWVPESIKIELQNTLVTGESYVSPIVFDDKNNGNIYFSAPIHGTNREVLGLLVARYDAGIFQDLIAANNGLAGPDSFGMLFDENHLQIAHGIAPEALYKTAGDIPSDQLEWLMSMNRLPNLPIDQLSAGLTELNSSLVNAEIEPIFTAKDIATGNRVNQVAVQYSNTVPWKIAFFQPRDAFLSPIDQLTRTSLLLGLLMVGIVAIAGTGASRLISAPITNLTQMVERIASGDLNAQVPATTQDEIGRLASAFNRLTSQIRSLLSSLELQVSDRTQELQRRALQLQTASEIARDATAAQDLDTLMSNTVNLISKRLDFYHVGIFLLDEAGENAVLRASNSEGGKRMLAEGHRLAVGQVGIVGDTTATGEPHIALDVETDSAHFAHPYLPETHSEMALPLKAGNIIIGALDVQSERQGAFDENDIAVLQIMADQIAIAIRNSQLIEEVQLSMFELQSAYGEHTQRSWKEWQQLAGSASGYRYQDGNIQLTVETPSHSALAYKRGRPVQNVSDGHSELAVPIRLRDSTFGTIHLAFDGEVVPSEITSLAGQIAERLALALDNARLLETTQKKALNEQLIREMTDQIRQTLDIETIIKTAAKEISNKLGLAALDIQIDQMASDESTLNRH